MANSAVQQAIRLLQSQLEAISPKAEALRAHIKESQGELEQLSREQAEIEKALTSLGAPLTPPKGTVLEMFANAVADVAEGLSVRAAVQKLLEETPRAFDSAEIAEVVTPMVKPGRTDVRASVSTAVWWLRNKKIITTLENGTHIATKWLPSPQELPVDAAGTASSGEVVS